MMNAESAPVAPGAITDRPQKRPEPRREPEAIVLLSKEEQIHAFQVMTMLIGDHACAN